MCGEPAWRSIISNCEVAWIEEKVEGRGGIEERQRKGGKEHEEEVKEQEEGKEEGEGRGGERGKGGGEEEGGGWGKGEEGEEDGPS